MDSITAAYSILLRVAASSLSLSACACLVRAICGPRFTDRIVSINVICTKAIIIIAVISVLLGDSNLLDIAAVYAMISFLAVVVLSKCYLSHHHANPADPEHDYEDARQNDENEEAPE